MAIEAATLYMLHQMKGESQENLQLIIYSDSQEALKALRNPGQQIAQFLIRNITKSAAEINQLKESKAACQRALSATFGYKPVE